MRDGRFRGFPAALFGFLNGLAGEAPAEWFETHHQDYETYALGPARALITELGPTLALLNPEFDTRPRLGRTISRIVDPAGPRAEPARCRPFFYVSFPRRGHPCAREALLYVGIYRHGVSAGFYPGGVRGRHAGPLQQTIGDNARLFQRYLTEHRLAETYYELAGEEGDIVTRWPLPRTARRWVSLETFTVGQYFPATDPLLTTRLFLDRARQVLLDLYPLWLFATSADIKEDFADYQEKIQALARPRRKTAV